MKAVFLDRDGVINQYPGHFKYVTRWEDFHFLPGVASSLERLTAFGFKIFIISNQAGVGKGLYSKQTLDLITDSMLKGLGKDVKIEGVFYCTHLPDDDCSYLDRVADLIVDLEFLSVKVTGTQTNFSLD